MKKKQLYTSILILLVFILIDQWIKIYIKTHFVLHESYEVASWFYLSFIENNGMAYGMEIGSKFFLTLFRIVAVGAFGVFLYRRISQSQATWTFVISMAMVLAGAIGNIVDCVFYGRWFTSSVGRVAQWADESAGLAPVGEWFEGRVVDMFYFPLIRFDWPAWVPAAGEKMQWLGLNFAWPQWMPCNDEPFMFFKPVFNFADAAISVGFGVLILLYLIECVQGAKNKKKKA